MLDTLL